MSYEPRGRVAVLLDAMRAEPQKVIWPADDVARVMGISKGNLTGYLDAVITHKMVYREIDNGRSWFSLKPFPEPKLPSATDTNSWRPPAMTPPRGSAPPPPTMSLPAAVAPSPPAPTPAECWPLLRATEKGNESLLVKLQRKDKAEPADDAVEGQVTEEEEPAQAFYANRCSDGDIDLYGLTELDSGGWRLEAKDVPVLLRLLGAVS